MEIRSNETGGSTSEIHCLVLTGVLPNVVIGWTMHLSI